jgi:hypothetical protein
MEFSNILPYLVSAVTGIAGWLAGSRKRRNDFLNDLQASIDLLAEKNRTQMEEIIRLREEIAGWRRENSFLREEVEKLNRKLDNVKTITQKVKNGN